MNCDGVSSLLSAYLDGELSPGELLRVEEHLRRCHACADEVDSLRQTVALVASLEEVEVPASFQVQLHDRLVAAGSPMAAVRRAPAVPSWQRNVRRWAVPAAAAAAALAIGMTQLPTGGNGPLDIGKSVFRTPPEQPASGGTKTADVTPPVTADPAPDKPVGTGVPVAPKDNDVAPKPPVEVAPGQTKVDGTRAAGTTTETPPPVKLDPKLSYTAEVVVEGALDAKTEAAIRDGYANLTKGNNELVIKVPNQQAAVDQLNVKVKEWWPTAKVTVTAIDLANDLQKAQSAMDSAKHVVEQDALVKTSDAEAAVNAKNLEKAQEALDAVKAQLTSAVFTVKFVQPVH